MSVSAPEPMRRIRSWSRSVPCGEPHVGHHALVLVVVGVEDEAPQRVGRPALRRRNAGDDRLEDLEDPRSLLGRREEHLLARDRENVLQLLDDDVRLGRGEVDLVDDRDDHEIVAQREMDVGQRLGLDPLGGIDHEDRALAGLQAAADLVAEVDVTGRVDQVEAVEQAVGRRVLQAHGARLDRDALLALKVHGVEDLARHLPGIDRVGELEEPVRERGLAVVDVGDDREVAQAILGDGHERGLYGTDGPGPAGARPGRPGVSICYHSPSRCCGVLSRRAALARPSISSTLPRGTTEQWLTLPAAGPARGRHPGRSGFARRSGAPPSTAPAPPRPRPSSPRPSRSPRASWKAMRPPRSPRRSRRSTGPPRPARSTRTPPPVASRGLPGT